MRVLAALALAACVPEAPPDPRLAYEKLQAPYIRHECRNHQSFAIEVDAHGREREIDNGRFCDLDIVE